MARLQFACEHCGFTIEGSALIHGPMGYQEAQARLQEAHNEFCDVLLAQYRVDVEGQAVVRTKGVPE